MATGSASAVGYACALGTWRSLVAHLLWEQGVAGSNPAVPMVEIPANGHVRLDFVLANHRLTTLRQVWRMPSASHAAWTTGLVLARQLECVTQARDVNESPD